MVATCVKVETYLNEWRNRQVGIARGGYALDMEQARADIGASWIGSADVAVQDRFLNNLDEGELLALPFLFEFWAMPHQLPPEGDWRSWVIMGGPRFGQDTRGRGMGACAGRRVAAPGCGALQACSAGGRDDRAGARSDDLCDSGILACSPADRRPDWEATRKRLVWPNGAVATVHTAHDPEGLRGPQFDAAWVDELAKWKKARRDVGPAAVCVTPRR